MIFDVLICFKQNHIVLNINPLHITCIFIKPRQALFAWKMFLSTYYFTRGLWSAIAYRNTRLISIILIWEKGNNLKLNSKLFIIGSNYLNCFTKLIYIKNEAEFVKRQLSPILFQHLLEHKITLKYNPLVTQFIATIINAFPEMKNYCYLVDIKPKNPHTDDQNITTQ